MINKVFIYHPSKYLGGTEVLFARVALLLRDRLGCQVTVVGYSENCAIRRALGSRVNEINFLDCCDPSFYAELDGSALVASARNIIKFYGESQRFGENARFYPLFWLLHPAELYSQVGVGYDRLKMILGYRFLSFAYKWNPFRFSFERLLKSLHNSGSLYFMDKSVLAESEWVMSCNFEGARFLHLITGYQQNKIYPLPGSSNNFVIVSRLESFKLPGIYKLLSDLEAAFRRGRWGGGLYIVGDGEGAAALQAYAEGLSYRVSFLGNVESDKLRDYLVANKFAALFGMGMSLLEGASIGMPCVILPASQVPVESDSCYVYLNENVDSLGEYFNSPAKGFHYLAFDDVLDLLGSELEGETSSFKFFNAHYSPDNGVNFFRELMCSAALSGMPKVPRGVTACARLKNFLGR